MDLLFSEELKTYAEVLEREYYEDLSPEEHEEARSARAFAGNIARLIVQGRERLLPNPNDNSLDIPSVLNFFAQEHPEMIERWLDEHYVFQQIENVPFLVRRTMRLSHLSARDTPSAPTNLYIWEASRAYIQGFQLSSIVMSRAALEQALKEKLGLQGAGEFHKLKNLIADAKKWNILSLTGASAAKDLVKKCDRVVHECPVENEDASFQILSGVRSLLEEIYSADGHY